MSPIGDYRLKVAALRDRTRLGLGRVRRSERVAATGEDQATEVEVRRHAQGVLELRLQGGSRRNALGRSTIDRIESLVSVPPVGTKVVVITADGPDFSAGYDLREAAHGDAEALIANGLNFALLKKSRVPVIAALHGNVIGGGLELALAADVRLASPNTKLGLPAGRLGLVYSEEGVRLLIDAVGESRARAMLLAGSTLTSAEAKLGGIVSEVVEPEFLDGRALELAATIASWSAVATSGNRRVLNVVVGIDHDDARELRLASFEAGGALAQSIERFASDHRDGVAETSKPSPVWRDRAGERLSSLRRRLSTEAAGARSLISSRARGRLHQESDPAPLVLASVHDQRGATGSD
jgi:enoyl-CoA hydratase